jgi:hypothetical protein
MPHTTVTARWPYPSRPEPGTPVTLDFDRPVGAVIGVHDTPAGATVALELHDPEAIALVTASDGDYGLADAR